MFAKWKCTVFGYLFIGPAAPARTKLIEKQEASQAVPACSGVQCSNYFVIMGGPKLQYQMLLLLRLTYYPPESSALVYSNDAANSLLPVLWHQRKLG
ncbi:uncharacterized protein LOC132053125 isoform X2 [Lycium ferocissimum]|uniref:uncharacterized protein LOC132053125 isoform X2 n=1 Tax=Lycium ferocissimum TaxID=112874 RepID=UPI0028154A2A|nr:uncharacterized protein LOC132053125 isoform X2 [Lycium ferocissimum]